MIMKKANGFSEKQNNPVYVNDNVNVNDNVLKDKTYTCAFEALWKAYPRKKEKAGAYRCYKARLADGNDNVNVNDNVLKDKTYTCAFEALWKAYPRKKEKAGAYRCYKARLADGFSEDELETAVKRYADECQRQKTEQKYIKLAATFLGPSTPFMDYLGEAEGYDTGGETATSETGYVKRLVDGTKYTVYGLSWRGGRI